MAHDVRAAANALLDEADKRGFAISNLALNKLLFFAHGWCLALYSKPLIDSPFEAWQFGPVHPLIHRQFKGRGDAAISSRATRIDPLTGEDVTFEYEFDEPEQGIIDRIVEFYGGMTAGRLVKISHEPGTPWDQIWSEADGTVSPGMIISDEIVSEYYKGKLARRS